MPDSQVQSVSADAPGRADKLLLEALRAMRPELSRSMPKQAFQDGRVRWKGRAIAASQELPAGRHELEIIGSLSASGAVPSLRGCFLRVLHEDDELLALDKRSGVPSVPHSSEETDSAVSAALAHYPALPGEAGSLEPGLLHRLDTGTSGVLLFAKSEAEFTRLRAAWKTDDVRKIYRAIVTPVAALPELKPCNLWMGHDAKSARRMRAAATEAGLYGIRGNALQATTTLRAKHGPRDLEIGIQTGLMHQIRATLAYLGAPILGDPIYGNSQADRLWLHAWKLSIPLRSGQLLELEAPLPEGWPRD